MSSNIKLVRLIGLHCAGGEVMVIMSEARRVLIRDGQWSAVSCV